MSQSAAVRTARAPRPVARHQLPPVTAPPRRQSPRLRVVSAPPRARSRAGLVVACVALLAVGLVGLLLLDVGLEKGTYELRDQNTRAEQLREQEQKLQQEILAREAPQDLAARARELGMVDAPGGPVFVLPDGRTIGVPQRAVASSSPNVTGTPSVGSTQPTPGRTPASSSSGGVTRSATPRAAQPTGPSAPTGPAMATARATAAATAAAGAPTPKPTSRGR
ncbi:MAG TPA: hypothetical protein VMT69_12825 [Kineosporiaceae bacterium]|nr:hypothetical protein [Kineosporiaceae bacterium]